MHMMFRNAKLANIAILMALISTTSVDISLPLVHAASEATGNEDQRIGSLLTERIYDDVMRKDESYEKSDLTQAQVKILHGFLIVAATALGSLASACIVEKKIAVTVESNFFRFFLRVIEFYLKTFILHPEISKEYLRGSGCPKFVNAAKKGIDTPSKALVRVPMATKLPVLVGSALASYLISAAVVGFENASRAVAIVVSGFP